MSAAQFLARETAADQMYVRQSRSLTGYVDKMDGDRSSWCLLSLANGALSRDMQ
jgi:hypothetical protein